MAQYTSPHTYEQQNDESLNRLFNKVHSLREVTINIHNDAEQQRGLIHDTSTAFDQFALNLKATANRFTNQVTRYAGSHKILTSIVLGFVGLWAIWFFFL